MITITGIIIYSFEIIQPEGVIFDKKRALAKKWENSGLDVRSMLEVLKDLESEGHSAAPFTTPYHFLSVHPFEINDKKVFPLSGISNCKTVLSNESGRWNIYQSDEHGFNNPLGLYNPNDVDIAIIGDSFTHGYGVDSDKNLVALIRERYPKTLNFGVGGAGELMRLAIFREYVERLKPKVVLWVYTDRTLGRYVQEKALLSYFNPKHNQGLFNMQPELDKQFREYYAYCIEHTDEYRPQNKWLNSLLLGRLRDRIYIIQNTKKMPKPETQRDIFRKILSMADTSVKGWGGKFIFVYLYMPTNHVGVCDHDFIVPLVKSLQIPVIDLYPAFEGAYHNQLRLSHELGHYNEEGYELVADVILKSGEIQEKISSEEQF